MSASAASVEKRPVGLLLLSLIAVGAVTGFGAAVIVRGRRRVPRADDVIGVVTKEHIADSVADTVKAYPQGT
jgi:hypothetical protein